MSLRRLIVAAVVLLIAPTNFAAEKPSAQMPAKHRALFTAHCLDCHDSESREGGVDLESLSFDLNTIENAERWQKVLGALNSGEMPPKDAEKIPDNKKREFLAALSGTLVNARKLLSDSGGVITMRRLNRREYANTIRSLLKVDVDTSDLPDDTNSSGFDTSGASLFFSSDQFEQYYKLGKQVLEDAIVTSAKKPNSKVVRRECEEPANKQVQNRLKAFSKNQARIDRYRKSGKPPTDFGFIDSDRVEFEQGQVDLNRPFFEHYAAQPESETGAILATSFQGPLIDVTELPKQPGDYIVRVRAGTLADAPVGQRFLAYGVREGNSRSSEISIQGYRKVEGSVKNPSVIEIPISVTKNSPRYFALLQRQSNNPNVRKTLYRRARASNGIGPKPSLWLDWVEVEGPLNQKWPPASHKSVFFDRGEDQSDPQYARAILKRFATKAFRGQKPTWKYLNRLVDLYQAERDKGSEFDQAIREPLAVILASPSFLYIREPAQNEQRRELSDQELAVRLSYFLWSSPPDNRLYELARSGKLKDPNTLAEQVDRMLADRRANEFISGFAHQWLHMERLDFFQFNELLYPKFDDAAKTAARSEVYETIAWLIKKDLPIERLLKSEVVVINDIMADYYNIPNVTGSQFRPVQVPHDSPRGGLLGSAAVLAMGSDGERSSPVERGAWILRKLLNDPPPPAPANVPQLSRLAGKPLSAREMQKAHMEQPQCAQCHDSIDPLGFGLENFDAAGNWRTHETVKQEVANKKRKRASKTKKVEIDASGKMPSGDEFGDFFQMRDFIASHQDDFARGFTESLIEYGLGRPYGFTDYELAESILAKTKNDNYRIRSFIHAIVQSESFRRK